MMGSRELNKRQTKQYHSLESTQDESLYIVLPTTDIYVLQ